VITVLLAIVVALVSLSGAFTAYNLTRLQKRVHELEHQVIELHLRQKVLMQMLERRDARHSN